MHKLHHATHMTHTCSGRQSRLLHNFTARELKQRIKGRPWWLVLSGAALLHREV